MAIACYKCGKEIKSKKYILTVPSSFEISLGINFEKAYHANCYKIAENDARLELVT